LDKRAMPTLKINGEEITVESGLTVIQAADRLGVRIPRYCYHPGLSIEGNCRICTVEIEKMPKPITACTTPAADGMVVWTDTPEVDKTRRGVLELLLLSHPLDCPVCDAAGECDLQNYYMAYGREDARFAESKLKRRKVADIGPTVLLDTERCILCTRCVRFTNEVSRSYELGVAHRGFRSEITLFPGQKLENLYSGCVVDICPVGALTDKDFRFQVRPWYLKSTPSICPHCSRGCNIVVDWQTERPHHGGGKRVFRLRPRYNEDVNRWWMCDIGRYGYHFVDSPVRLRSPLVTSGEDNAQMVPTDWERAIEEAADALAVRPTLVISAESSNEELWAFRRLVGDEARALCWLPPRESPDHLLFTGDLAPNRRGAELLGYEIHQAKDPAAAIREAATAAGGLLVVGKSFVDSLPPAGSSTSTGACSVSTRPSIRSRTLGRSSRSSLHSPKEWDGPLFPQTRPRCSLWRQRKYRRFRNRTSCSSKQP
jgi:NADH-quinone oxidoreductase subunit G